MPRTHLKLLKGQLRDGHRVAAAVLHIRVVGEQRGLREKGKSLGKTVRKLNCFNSVEGGNPGNSGTKQTSKFSAGLSSTGALLGSTQQAWACSAPWLPACVTRPLTESGEEYTPFISLNTTPL